MIWPDPRMVQRDQSEHVGEVDRAMVVMWLLVFAGCAVLWAGITCVVVWLVGTV